MEKGAMKGGKNGNGGMGEVEVGLTLGFIGLGTPVAELDVCGIAAA